jgi:hypothetical protein
MERFGYGCSRDETFPGSGDARFGIADGGFLYQPASSFNLQDAYKNSAVVKGCSTSAMSLV